TTTWRRASPSRTSSSASPPAPRSPRSSRRSSGRDRRSTPPPPSGAWSCMASSKSPLMLPLLAACSIPPESDYVSDGSLPDVAAPDVAPEASPLDARPDTAPSPCADASYTFNGHCYVFYATRSDWHSAESQCAFTGGHLAAINDVNEQGYVAATIV